MTSGRVTSTAGKGRRVFLGSLTLGKPLGGDPWRGAGASASSTAHLAGRLPCSRWRSQDRPSRSCAGFPRALGLPGLLTLSVIASVFPMSGLDTQVTWEFMQPTNSVIPVSFRGHRGLWWDPEICAPSYRPPLWQGATFVPVTRESSPGAQELMEGAQKQASPTSAGRQGVTLPTPQSWGKRGLAITQPEGHCSHQGYSPVRPVSQPPALLGPFLHLGLLEACRGAMVGAKQGQAPRGTSSSPTGPASPCNPGGQGRGCLDDAVWGEEGGALSTADSWAGSLNIELFPKQIAGSGKGFTIIYKGGRTHSLPGVPHCQRENH